MYSRMTDETLKSGERMEVGVVLGPDKNHSEKIKPFLSHKPEVWGWHIEKSLKEGLDGLETRYYIGMLDGNVISNITTLESHRTGILAHVFTNPDQRRKGACDHLMRHLMADFRTRGGCQLVLGTGFDSPPYWIYHKHGFRSLYPGTGEMRYAAEADFDLRHFAGERSRVIELSWKDWPRLNALCASPGQDIVRGVSWGIIGQINFEGGFLDMKRALETDGRIQARLLESENGSVVGFASVAPDRRWGSDAFILDCFSHSNYIGELNRLLEAIQLPSGKIQAYADADGKDKIQALQEAGFGLEATLERQLAWRGERLDVVLMSRFV